MNTKKNVDFMRFSDLSAFESERLLPYAVLLGASEIRRHQGAVDEYIEMSSPWVPVAVFGKMRNVLLLRSTKDGLKFVSVTTYFGDSGKKLHYRDGLANRAMARTIVGAYRVLFAVSPDIKEILTGAIKAVEAFSDSPEEFVEMASKTN